MAQFVTGSFNTMDPRLLSPIQQAINEYGQIQQNRIARQKAEQAGMETSVFPKVLDVGMLSNLSPLVSTLLSHPKVAVALAPETQSILSLTKNIAAGQPMQTKDSGVTAWTPIYEKLVKESEQPTSVVSQGEKIVEHPISSAIKGFSELSNVAMAPSKPAQSIPVQSKQFIPSGAGWVQHNYQGKNYWVNQNTKQVLDMNGNEVPM